MPGIKFWTDGLETVDETDARPLGDAERAELERQQRGSKRLKLMARVAEVAVGFSVFVIFLGGDRVPRHRWEWVVVACTWLALAARFIAKRLS